MSKRTNTEPRSTSLASRLEPISGDRRSMQLGLDAVDVENLEKVAARLREHPLIGRLHVNLGREKAARYAIAYCAKHMPAQPSD